jgi:hypothetical protein
MAAPLPGWRVFGAHVGEDATVGLLASAALAATLAVFVALHCMYRWRCGAANAQTKQDKTYAKVPAPFVPRRRSRRGDRSTAVYCNHYDVTQDTSNTSCISDEEAAMDSAAVVVVDEPIVAAEGLSIVTPSKKMRPARLAAHVAKWPGVLRNKHAKRRGAAVATKTAVPRVALTRADLGRCRREAMLTLNTSSPVPRHSAGGAYAEARCSSSADDDDECSYSSGCSDTDEDPALMCCPGAVDDEPVYVV